MATRSSTSEFQPAPPVNRLHAGRVELRIAIVNSSTSTGVKANMCVPPTGGDGRLFAVSPRP